MTPWNLQQREVLTRDGSTKGAISLNNSRCVAGDGWADGSPKATLFESELLTVGT
jgi:hypothetical protein